MQLSLTEEQLSANGLIVDLLNDIAVILADALALVATLAGGILDIVDVIL
ncbi:MAG: hypothetical protein HRU09_19035 [Oligoflexales bacterium]|nr:hypothetical protein [Oligoflexales bacterium]